MHHAVQIWHHKISRKQTLCLLSSWKMTQSLEWPTMMARLSSGKRLLKNCRLVVSTLTWCCTCAWRGPLYATKRYFFRLQDVFGFFAILSPIFYLRFPGEPRVKVSGRLRPRIRNWHFSNLITSNFNNIAFEHLRLTLLCQCRNFWVLSKSFGAVPSPRRVWRSWCVVLWHDSA